MGERLRSVPVVSSARFANKQVPAACVMRKPILEDYLFYKELRQVLPAERVDDILADEQSALSSFVSSPQAWRERARWQRSFHCRYRIEKGQPQCSEDSDSDGENPYIGCCRRDAGIEGERIIGCES